MQKYSDIGKLIFFSQKKKKAKNNSKKTARQPV